MEFQWCIGARLLPHLPNFLGFEVINVQGDHSHAETRASLFILALWNVLCVSWGLFPAAFQAFTGTPAPKQKSHLRTVTMLMVGVTAFFFLALMTNLNKIVVLWAAVHNYFEWHMLGFVYIHFSDAFQWLAADKSQRLIRWQRMVTWWILFVFVGILAIPDTIDAFAFEEVVGLWPDFQLFFFAVMCWRNAPAGMEHCYMNFTIAATFHLAQIFVLLGQGMGLVAPFPEGQLLIMVLSFFNYAFMVRFVLSHDHELEAEHDSQIQNASWVGPRIPLFMAICFCFSASAVLGPPLVLGECVHTVMEPQTSHWNVTHLVCNQSQTCSERTFKDMQRELVQHAWKLQEVKGNKASRVFFKEGEALLVSKWDDMPVELPTLPVVMTDALKIQSSTWRQVEVSSSSGTEFPTMDSLEHRNAGNAKNNSLDLCPSLTKTRFVRLQPKSSFFEAVQIKMASMIPDARARGANFYFNFIAPRSDELLVIEQWQNQEALQEQLSQPSVWRLFLFAPFMTRTYVIQGGFFELVPCSDVVPGVQTQSVAGMLPLVLVAVLVALLGGAFAWRWTCLRRQPTGPDGMGPDGLGYQFCLVDEKPV